MHIGLSFNMMSDHAKKELVANYICDNGVSQDGAAHAASCMLLTRLTILIRTIGTALWLVDMGGKRR